MLHLTSVRFCGFHICNCSLNKVPVDACCDGEMTEGLVFARDLTFSLNRHNQLHSNFAGMY